MLPASGMRALSIRQPHAELILRGQKTVEYRTRPTLLIGQPFYIYAAKNRSKVSGVPCEGDMTVDELVTLPRGLIVGTAVIVKCVAVRDQNSLVRHNGSNHARAPLTSDLRRLTSVVYEWHLSDVKRLDQPRKPKRMPQPVWFRPF